MIRLYIDHVIVFLSLFNLFALSFANIWLKNLYIRFHLVSLMLIINLILFQILISTFLMDLLLIYRVLDLETCKFHQYFSTFTT